MMDNGFPMTMVDIAIAVAFAYLFQCKQVQHFEPLDRAWKDE